MRGTAHMGRVDFDLAPYIEIRARIDDGAIVTVKIDANDVMNFITARQVNATIEILEPAPKVEVRTDG